MARCSASATAACFVTPYGIEFSEASRPTADAVFSRLLSLARETRVGEEHVDGPKSCFGRRDQRLYLAFLCNIRSDGKSADLACDARKLIAGAFEIGDHHASRAGLRIGAGDRLANPARGSGDDIDLVLDVHACASCFAMMIRAISNSTDVEPFVPRLTNGQPRQHV